MGEDHYNGDADEISYDFKLLTSYARDVIQDRPYRTVVKVRKKGTRRDI